jgi:hypothetical protein
MSVYRYISKMAANHTNQGLNNSDYWALQQLLIKANTEQLLFIEKHIGHSIRMRTMTFKEVAQ